MTKKTIIYTTIVISALLFCGLIGGLFYLTNKTKQLEIENSVLEYISTLQKADNAELQKQIDEILQTK